MLNGAGFHKAARPGAAAVAAAGQRLDGTCCWCVAPVLLLAVPLAPSFGSTRLRPGPGPLGGGGGGRPKPVWEASVEECGPPCARLPFGLSKDAALPAADDDSQDPVDSWTTSAELEAQLGGGEACEIVSGWLWQEWDGLEVECSVRYRKECCAAWSPWSDACSPFAVRLPPPRAPTSVSALRVDFSRSDPMSAELCWDPFTCSSDRVESLQYRVELRAGNAPSGGSGAWRVADDGGWSPVCTLEQPARSGSASLSCALRRLLPARTYTARVRARHWRVDREWRAELSHCFQAPPSVAEGGIPPPRPMLDTSLGAGPSAAVPSTETGATDFIWCAFLLPPVVAGWDAADLSLEWSRAEAGAEEAEWVLADSERCTLAGADRGPPQGGCGVRVRLPSVPEEVLVRCRHVSGAVSSMVPVVPLFLPPPPPGASLRVADQGLSIVIAGQVGGESSDAALTRYQFVVEAVAPCLSGEGAGARITTGDETAALEARELEVLQLPVVRTGEGEPRVQQELCCEDLADLLSAAGWSAIRFRARAGDCCRWSSWSEPSASLAVTVAPPRPAPAATGRLEARALPRCPHDVELSWPRFIGAAGLAHIDYRVRAAPTAPTASAEDRCEQFLPGELIQPGDGTCRAVLRRLMPGTEYAFQVFASYPKLARFCEESPAPGSLSAVFTTPAVDAWGSEPPKAPQGLPPPAPYGGSDQRAPWGWDFWLGLDPRALQDLPRGCPATYEVQWREVSDGEATATDWVPVELHAPAPMGDGGPAVCRWDFSACLEAAAAAPERVELRLRIAEAQRLASPPWQWRSRPSEPLATAFAEPPKPRVALCLASPGQLEIRLAFHLCAVAPGLASAPGALALASERGDDGAAPPEGVRAVPEAFGHRFATRLQLRRRLAGDRNVGQWSVLRPQAIDRSARAKDEEGGTVVAAGWSCLVSTVPVCHPEFAEGDKVIFAVRIGDGMRWSAWSASSKPVHVRLPQLKVPGETLHVAQEGQDQVLCEWAAASSELGVPVEYAVWVSELGQDGKDSRGGRQLCTLHAAPPLLPSSSLAERQCIAASVGHLCGGQRYGFVLLARHDCCLLGASTFQEVASSEPLTWHGNREDDAPSSSSGLAALESWDLPVPLPLPVPEAVECGGGRWRGKAVLLAWPRGCHVGEDLPLELQGREDPAAAPADGGYGSWVAVSRSLVRTGDNKPRIVAAPLPFLRCRFRWYSRDRCVAGPESEACLAHAEAPPEPRAEVVWAADGGLGIRLIVCLPSGARSLTPFCQVRYRPADLAECAGGGSESRVGPAADWVSLSPQLLDEPSHDEHGAEEHFSLLLCEGDGLEAGRRYVLSARVCDRRRRSQWSESSGPVLFEAPACPRAAEGESLRVEALTSSSARFWWRGLRAVEPCGQPLEHRLEVSRVLPGSRYERHATLLLEEEAGRLPCEATVNGLLPGSRYFAALAVRWSRAASCEWGKTGLKAGLLAAAHQSVDSFLQTVLWSSSSRETYPSFLRGVLARLHGHTMCNKWVLRTSRTCSVRLMCATSQPHHTTARSLQASFETSPALEPTLLPPSLH